MHMHTLIGFDSYGESNVFFVGSQNAVCLVALSDGYSVDIDNTSWIASSPGSLSPSSLFYMYAFYLHEITFCVNRNHMCKTKRSG